jgi:hypothetical protein
MDVSWFRSGERINYATTTIIWIDYCLKLRGEDENQARETTKDSQWEREPLARICNRARHRGTGHRLLSAGDEQCLPDRDP